MTSVPILFAFATVLSWGLSSTTPIEFKTVGISYSPETSMVINENKDQLFRAPLCKGMFIGKWSFTVKAYLMNVQWDSRPIGDDNWLRIRVYTSADMKTKVCDTASNNAADPAPACSPFTYDPSTWGDDDLYVLVTSSSGSATYQYGLEVVASENDALHPVPDAISSSVNSEGDFDLAKDLETFVMEQVAVPFVSKLTTGTTGQYKVPFCFEDSYIARRMNSVSLVSDVANDGRAGGVTAYMCTDKMLNNNECFRGVVKRRGQQFYDASGAMIASVTTDIKKEEFGPVHVLVQAQGDYRKDITFTITAKLVRDADQKMSLKSSGNLLSVVDYLQQQFLASQPLPEDINTLYPGDEL